MGKAAEKGGPIATPEARLERAKRMITAGVAEAIDALKGSSDWIDQHHSPLGRRRHNALAREGKLASRKLGRLILIRRTDIDAYIEREGIARGRRVSEDDGVDEMLERITRGSER